jgi:hypothetical protein
MDVMKKLRLHLDQLTPILLGGGLGAIYLASMAPGLTWANYGSDGGDLIAAATTGGVAHPTGYPVYLLIARLFQLIPIGSLAYRTNLMSGVAMTSAAVLVYGSVTRFLFGTVKRSPRLPGLVSACAFGLAPLVWSQAVITEVYALQAFFIALIFYLCTNRVSPRRDRLCGLILGLALGAHLTTMFLVPVVLLANGICRRMPDDLTQPKRISRWRDFYLDWKSLLRQFVFLLAGSLIYLILPLRAGSHPPVNWGNPVTLGRFWWLVSGQLYQSDLSGLAIPALWERVQAWAVLFLGQFGLLGFVLGLMGLVVFFNPTRLHLITLWAVIAFSAFAIIYDTSDSFVYLIPAILSFAIWIGLGLDGIMDIFSRRWPKRGWIIGVVFLVYLFGLSIYNWPRVGASHDQRAETFGREVMATAPAHAILFTNGDSAIFTLWYFHYALKQRPDIVVVANDLLPFDWYRGSLRGAYPDLVLPDLTDKPWFTAISEANPLRPVCYLYNVDSVEIDCR